MSDSDDESCQFAAESESVAFAAETEESIAFVPAQSTYQWSAQPSSVQFGASTNTANGGAAMTQNQNNDDDDDDDDETSDQSMQFVQESESRASNFGGSMSRSASARPPQQNVFQKGAPIKLNSNSQSQSPVIPVGTPAVAPVPKKSIVSNALKRSGSESKQQTLTQQNIQRLNQHARNQQNQNQRQQQMMQQQGFIPGAAKSSIMRGPSIVSESAYTDITQSSVQFESSETTEAVGAAAADPAKGKARVGAVSALVTAELTRLQAAGVRTRSAETATTTDDATTSVQFGAAESQSMQFEPSEDTTTTTSEAAGAGAGAAVGTGLQNDASGSPPNLDRNATGVFADGIAPQLQREEGDDGEKQKKSTPTLGAAVPPPRDKPRLGSMASLDVLSEHYKKEQEDLEKKESENDRKEEEEEAKNRRKKTAIVKNSATTKSELNQQQQQQQNGKSEARTGQRVERTPTKKTPTKQVPFTPRINKKFQQQPGTTPQGKKCNEYVPFGCPKAAAAAKARAAAAASAATASSTPAGLIADETRPFGCPKKAAAAAANDHQNTSASAVTASFYADFNTQQKKELQELKKQVNLERRQEEADHAAAEEEENYRALWRQTDKELGLAVHTLSTGMNNNTTNTRSRNMSPSSRSPTRGGGGGRAGATTAATGTPRRHNGGTSSPSRNANNNIAADRRSLMTLPPGHFYHTYKKVHQQLTGDEHDQQQQQQSPNGAAHHQHPSTAMTTVPSYAVQFTRGGARGIVSGGGGGGNNNNMTPRKNGQEQTTTTTTRSNLGRQIYLDHSNSGFMSGSSPKKAKYSLQRIHDVYDSLLRLVAEPSGVCMSLSSMPPSQQSPNRHHHHQYGHGGAHPDNDESSEQQHRHNIVLITELLLDAHQRWAKIQQQLVWIHQNHLNNLDMTNNTATRRRTLEAEAAEVCESTTLHPVECYFIHGGRQLTREQRREFFQLCLTHISSMPSTTSSSTSPAKGGGGQKSNHHQHKSFPPTSHHDNFASKMLSFGGGGRSNGGMAGAAAGGWSPFTPRSAAGMGALMHHNPMAEHGGPSSYYDSYGGGGKASISMTSQPPQVNPRTRTTVFRILWNFINPRRKGTLSSLQIRRLHQRLVAMVRGTVTTDNSTSSEVFLIQEFLSQHVLPLLLSTGFPEWDFPVFAQIVLQALQDEQQEEHAAGGHRSGPLQAYVDKLAVAR